MLFFVPHCSRRINFLDWFRCFGFLFVIQRGVPSFVIRFDRWKFLSRPKLDAITTVETVLHIKKEATNSNHILLLILYDWRYFGLDQFFMLTMKKILDDVYRLLCILYRHGYHSCLHSGDNNSSVFFVIEFQICICSTLSCCYLLFCCCTILLPYGSLRPCHVYRLNKS